MIVQNNVHGRVQQLSVSCSVANTTAELAALSQTNFAKVGNDSDLKIRSF